MKFKFLSLMFILSIFLIIPTVVLGYEDVDNYEENKITYQLFSDGSAKILAIEDDVLSNSLSVLNKIWYKEEEYQVTSIEKNVFDSILTEKELCLYFENAPILEGENSFDNITNIYVWPDAQGYTKEAGWPIEKIKQYVVELQPQDVVVTPEQISDEVFIETRAGIVVGAGTLVYSWYSCDADGKILDDSSVSSYANFKIPFDLSYDNENNLPKDYYYVCVIGEKTDFPEKTKVAKVTVNPGPYKVSFDCGELAQWSIDSKDGLIETFTNNDRKLETSDIPSSDLLVNNGKGVSFAGWWSIDKDKIVEPSTEKFENNTILSAMWKFKVNFDANGGKFADESTIFSLNYITDNYNTVFEDDIIEPVREGYKFLGYFTEKENGEPYEFILDSMVLNEETTFYAQWEKLDNSTNDGSFAEGSEQEEPSNDETTFENLNKDEVNDNKTEDEDIKDDNENKTDEDDLIKGDNENKADEDDLIKDDNENKADEDDLIKEEISEDKNSNENIDKPINNNSNGNTQNKEEINTPQTGDDILLYTVLLITSLGGILITSVLKRNIY